MTTAAPGPYRVPLERLEASARVPVDAQVESVPPVRPPVEEPPQPDARWFAAGG
jgi:hypothetical protein